jgi:Flp pilus assembly pilin Flp
LAGEEAGGRRVHAPGDQKKEEVMWLINEALSRIVTRLRRAEGQTLVEYALIIALVSVMLVAALGFLRGDIEGVFTAIGNAFG